MKSEQQLHVLTSRGQQITRLITRPTCCPVPSCLMCVFHLYPQTLVQLNPKLQPMLDMIRANRAKWEELDNKRQERAGHSISAPASPRSGDSSETGGCTVPKTGSTPCCSSEAGDAPSNCVS